MADDDRQQLSEYISQLADVNEMLAADPSDVSLIKLREDLTELITLTKTEVGGKDQVISPSPPNGGPDFIAPSAVTAVDATVTATVSDLIATDHNPSLESVEKDPPPAAVATAAAVAPGKKKIKKSSKAVPDKFELPDHLRPLDSDTDAERKRKSRAAKALKSKWRERRKEMEGAARQQSWKNFATKGPKKDKTKKRSIFATEEGVNAKVGVISGTTGVRAGMTEYDGRKRHKQH